MRKNWLYILIFILISSITFFVLSNNFKADSLINKNNNMEYKDIVLFSIGDSLTEGIGDESLDGGFVSILGQYLEDEFNSKSLKVYNNGKSGDKTHQLVSRIEESIEIQNEIKEATIITITIGGNDLMGIVKDNIFNATVLSKIENEKKVYLNNLNELYKVIRKYNKKSDIYHLGIYNPFYLYFQDIKEMQNIVDLWNNTTSDFLKEQKNAFFVPINDKIYEGSGLNNENANDLLSSDDYFHPNFQGYQIIADEFRKKIVFETKK